tara:strand:- start:296 stop:1225 length:930 start_codon:yes stop_codon:yes gene_type:complete
MSNIEECYEIIKADCFSFFKKEETKSEKFSNKKKMLKKILIPLCFWIMNKKDNLKRTLFLGISGGQGSGKTTIAKLLEIILSKYFNKKVCTISIDDFYKTLKERQNLSKKKYFLLKTRGIPGTHDISFIFNLLKNLKRKKFIKTYMPKFDKSIDDRLKKSRWKKIEKKPDIVILEGWCIGAKPQIFKKLRKPINKLEQYEDKKMIWRNFANSHLKRSYKKLFSKIDEIIFLKVPNFSLITQWRLKQEKKLNLRNKFSKNKKIMSYSQILRFVMFYQRITLQMFLDLPKIASVVMCLNNNHEIQKIYYNN